MSTIATQLNWGASYIINDFYRRFWKKEETEKHYVSAAQVATVCLMLVSLVVTYYQSSISGAWKFLMALGAGTGSVFILRWFWWRINAWSEISAMAASFVVSLVLMYGFKLNSDDPRQFAYSVLITVACSTAVWLTTTFLTEPESKEKLLSFYRKARPNAALWGEIAREAVETVPPKDGLNNLLDFVAGCVMVYLTLFGIGNILFGRTVMGLSMLGGAAVAACVVYWDLNRRGWKVID
jgi:Na+/proline symporter